MCWCYLCAPSSVTRVRKLFPSDNEGASTWNLTTVRVPSFSATFPPPQARNLPPVEPPPKKGWEIRRASGENSVNLYRGSDTCVTVGIPFCWSVHISSDVRLVWCRYELFCRSKLLLHAVLQIIFWLITIWKNPFDSIWRVIRSLYWIFIAVIAQIFVLASTLKLQFLEYLSIPLL